jgi:Na+/melibiose symporter-like transporter
MSSSAKNNTALLAPGAAAKALSLRTKVSYGLPMIFLNGAGIVVRTVLPKYYNDELGVGVGTLSLTIFVCGMIDLASSIAFAYAGDTFGRTRWGARWGRRKPFIAVGTPFLAVAVLFLLFPPPSVTASATSAAAWFAGAYTFYVLAMQCVGVAYDAMGPAVTLDGQQRGSLYSWKAGLGVGGLIVFAGFQAGTAGLGEAAQTKTLGIMLCALAFVCYGALLRFVPLPAAPLPASSASASIAKQPALVPGVHLCGRNAQWRAFVLLSAGMSLLNEITAVAAFYVQCKPLAPSAAARPTRH